MNEGGEQSLSVTLGPHPSPQAALPPITHRSLSVTLCHSPMLGASTSSVHPSRKIWSPDFGNETREIFAAITLRPQMIYLGITRVPGGTARRRGLSWAIAWGDYAFSCLAHQKRASRKHLWSCMIRRRGHSSIIWRQASALIHAITWLPSYGASRRRAM